MSGDYREAGVKPCLDEILADPIVRLILRRDGIALKDLVEFLGRVCAKQARGGASGLGAPSGVSGAAPRAGILHS